MIGLAEDSTTVHERSLAAIARYGIRQDLDSTQQIDVTPAIVASCRQAQILPHLLRALCEGAISSSNEQTVEITELVSQELRVSLTLERELLEVSALLEDGSIPYRVLKGLGSAHLDYPTPAVRQSVDVDLLVEGHRIDEVKSLLTDHGHMRLGHERRPGFDAAYEKSITFRSPRRVEIDLHRSLASGPFGFVFDPSCLLQDEERFVVANRELPALSREDRFLHACSTAVISDARRLRPARDVVEMMINPRLDAEKTLERAERRHVSILVATAVRESVRLLGLDGIVEHRLLTWSTAYRPTRRDRDRLRCYELPKSASYVRRVVGTARELRGVGQKSNFMLAMIAPDKRAAPRSNRDRVTRAFSAVARGGRGAS